VRHIPVPVSLAPGASCHLMIKSGSWGSALFDIEHRRNDHATKETLIDPRAAEIRLGVKGLTSRLSSIPSRKLVPR